MGLLELVKDLNDLIESEENPMVTSKDYLFLYRTDGNNQEMMVGDQISTWDEVDEYDTEEEILDYFLKEINASIEALQSAKWAAEQLKKRITICK